MATTIVRLTKKWSDWAPGDVVKLERERAKRVIAAGFGREDRSTEAARIADVERRGAPPLRHPQAETAMRKPAAERAVATPELIAPPEEAEAAEAAPALTGASAESEEAEATPSEESEPVAEPGRRGRLRGRKAGD